MAISLPRRLVQNDCRSHSCVERFDLRRMRDDNALVCLRKRVAGNPGAFVANQQRHSTFEIGLGKRRSFMRRGGNHADAVARELPASPCCEGSHPWQL